MKLNIKLIVLSIQHMLLKVVIPLKKVMMHKLLLSIVITSLIRSFGIILLPLMLKILIRLLLLFVSQFVFISVMTLPILILVVHGNLLLNMEQVLLMELMIPLLMTSLKTLFFFNVTSFLRKMLSKSLMKCLTLRFLKILPSMQWCVMLLKLLLKQRN